MFSFVIGRPFDIYVSDVQLYCRLYLLFTLKNYGSA